MGGLTPWVTRLLIVNVAVFFFLPRNTVLFQSLMYYPPAAFDRPWTIVTYMFLHGSAMHLGGNMIGLFFFGPRLEQRLGGWHFITMYFLAGICGALLQTIFAGGVPMIGASGGVFGVLVGFAMFWPRQQIMIFPLPIPIEAWILVAFYIVGSLVAGFGQVAAGIAHFAHLGGVAGAFGYIRLTEWKRGSAKREFRRKLNHDASPKGAVGDKLAVARWQGISIESLHELNREEVRRLLAKVGSDGARSLTESEREFLDRMSRA